MEDLFNKDLEDTDYNGDNEQLIMLDKKQRELITSTVDYNLESISNLITKKTIDLAPRYQRRFRWDVKRKSRLIESFLMNVPIPPIFLNEDDYGTYSVIDGKQRLAAITDFLSGNLTLEGLDVFKDLNGLSFFDLPRQYQNTLKTRANIRAIIILRQSDPNIKYEVFQRLNTGGVKLNAQEIRNSAFPGSLNNKILELSDNKAFHKLLGIRAKTKSRVYQEMKDAELILRFFALKDNWQKYPGNLKKILDTYLDTNKNMDKKNVSRLEKDFLITLERVKVVFGNTGCFRRWLPQGKWKKQVSAPLFDAQMFACYGVDIELLKEKKDVIVKMYQDLFQEDLEFISSIESSTATPANFLYRINILKEIINED